MTSSHGLAARVPPRCAARAERRARPPSAPAAAARPDRPEMARRHASRRQAHRPAPKRRHPRCAWGGGAGPAPRARPRRPSCRARPERPAAGRPASEADRSPRPRAPPPARRVAAARPRRRSAAATFVPPTRRSPRVPARRASSAPRRSVPRSPSRAARPPTRAPPPAPPRPAPPPVQPRRSRAASRRRWSHRDRVAQRPPRRAPRRLAWGRGAGSSRRRSATSASRYRARPALRQLPARTRRSRRARPESTGIRGIPGDSRVSGVLAVGYVAAGASTLDVPESPCRIGRAAARGAREPPVGERVSAASGGRSILPAVGATTGGECDRHAAREGVWGRWLAWKRSEHATDPGRARTGEPDRIRPVQRDGLA